MNVKLSPALKLRPSMCLVAVSGNVATAYATAAASPAALTELLYGIAAKFLSNIPDANGVNLLYAGV